MKRLAKIVFLLYILNVLLFSGYAEGLEIEAEQVEASSDVYSDEAEIDINDIIIDGGNTSTTDGYAVEEPEMFYTMNEPPMSGETGGGNDESTELQELLLNDEISGDEYGVEAAPLIGGYVAVAYGAQGYNDVDLSIPKGQFLGDSLAYAESSESTSAVLKLYFDTEESRAWGGDILSCYVSRQDILELTQDESQEIKYRLSADQRTRDYNGILLPCADYDDSAYAVMAEPTVIGLDVQAHTQEEIQAFVYAHPSYRNQPDLYRTTATRDPYVPAKLMEFNQISALNMVNQIRFIAGLDANVGLDWEQESIHAATALINGLNRDISHYPERPAVLADAAYDSLYEQAAQGARTSNLHGGSGITGSVLSYVSDANNRVANSIGHRLWVLSSRMGKTIFGSCPFIGDWLDDNSGMYAFDSTGSTNNTMVAWPAQETPIQYFSSRDAWSLSLKTAFDIQNISVSLVRLSDGRTWSFSSTASEGTFYKQDAGYGGWTGSVVFRPDGLDSFSAGDTFNVSVSNAATGEDIRYTVRFFNLDLSMVQGFATPSVLALIMSDGNHVSWNAIEGAEGYFIFRKVNDGGYEFYTDVPASMLSYVDSAVAPNVEYYYAVYAHNSYMSGNAGTSKARIPVPDAVDISPDGTVTIYNNMTLQLNPVLTPSYAITTLTWESSKPEVAVVDANGLVTPVKNGAAIISVRTDNGKSASMKVEIKEPPKPQKVLLSAGGTVVMSVGETIQLSATVQPEGATQSVAWSSTKAAVATVDNGLVSAVGEGKATINAKAINGKKATVKINVVDPYKPAGIAIAQGKAVTITMGQPLQLNVALAPESARATLTWTSSKAKVATVDGNGLVTPQGEGKTKITVKTQNKKKATITVQVVDPNKPLGIAIAQGKAVTLKVGEVLQLGVGLNPATAQSTLTWKTNKAAIATVDANGVVTAVKKGKAKITVTTYNKKKATITVNVVP